MSPYVIFPIVGFITSGILAGYVLSMNPKHPLNRQYFFICLCFIVWSAANFFSPIVQTPKAALLAHDFMAIGIIFLTSIFLHFALIFTKKKKILSQKITYLWLYFPSVFFLLLTWFTDLIYVRQPVKMYFGYEQDMGSMGWTFLLYVAIFYITALYLCARFYFTTPSWQEKKQARYVIIGFLFPVIIGILDAILYSLKILVLPQPMPVSSAIAAAFIAYAIRQYAFLAITPQLAAETIVKTIPDFLLVLDNKLNINLVNSKTLDVLGYRKEDLQNQPFEKILTGGEEIDNLKKVVKESPLENYELEYLTKGKESISVSLNSYPVYDKSGRQILGIVTIARDMRENHQFIQRLEEDKTNLANQSQELDKLNQELKSRYQDMERMNNLMTGRELKMVELKKEIADLKKKAEKAAG